MYMNMHAYVYMYTYMYMCIYVLIFALSSPQTFRHIFGDSLSPDPPRTSTFNSVCREH